MPVADPVISGDQVRHDGVSLFNRRVNNILQYDRFNNKATAFPALLCDCNPESKEALQYIMQYGLTKID
jgi:hypothetical protein